MSPTEKVIDKLKKLHNMSQSAREIGNEAEAQAFAEMFQRLLLVHKLEMTDIEFNLLDKEEPVGNQFIDFTKYPDFKVKRGAVQWQSILAKIVADAHFCDIVRFTNSNTFYLVGRKSDSEVAEYAIITLLRAADKIATREYGIFYRQCQSEDGHPKRARGFRDAFLLGFINRLKERYDYMRNGDGKVLAMVRIAKERKAVIDFVAAQTAAGETRTLTTRKRWAMNEAGRRRGRELADSMDLGGKAMKTGSVKGELG